MRYSLKSISKEYLATCQSRGYTEKTMTNKIFYIKKIIAYLNTKRGIQYADQVTTEDLNSYIYLRKTDGKNTAQSIKCIYVCLHAFFNWMTSPKNNYLKTNPLDPIGSPKVPKKIIYAFSTDEVRRMINAYGKTTFTGMRNRCMISMMADTGMRAIEIRRIRLSNIRNDIIFVLGKGDKERVVPNSPALKRTVVQYERVKKDYVKHLMFPTKDYYFLNYRGEQLTHTGTDWMRSTQPPASSGDILNL